MAYYVPISYVRAIFNILNNCILSFLDFSYYIFHLCYYIKSCVISMVSK
ncbi:hypothetical protein [Orientia tsutsugamushi]|nr:hypothetical protein [Orientia tsutsugamushi]